jgi:hypothetical protein
MHFEIPKVGHMRARMSEINELFFIPLTAAGHIMDSNDYNNAF